MRRIFVKDILRDELVITGQDAHHLGYVMRSRAGDCITVADDTGQVGEYELTSFTENTVTMRLVKLMEESKESNIEIVLGQCLLKGDKMDWVAQKVTELGVNALVPVASANCVVKYDAKKAAARQEKWQKIAHEAGKQCGRDILPQVFPITSLSAWLSELAEKYQAENTAICMCYENEEQQGIKPFLQANKAADRVIVIIGPEGGFSLDEAAHAKELGIASVSLGRRILRAETAAIAAVAAVQYENGDLGG